MLSRCRVFVLNSLSVSDVEEVLQHALKHPHGFPGMIINCEEGVIPLIAQFANGDARIALNTFEMAVLNSEKNEQKVTLTMDTLKQLINTKSLRYDKKGEEHYNIISALHKSMRNSECDASLFLGGKEETTLKSWGNDYRIKGAQCESYFFPAG